MTFHQHMAGSEAVYAFMLGSPSFYTRAEFNRGFRAQAEMEIERLIALLDFADGDENIEETGDLEPYLGWNGTGARFGTGDDREAEDEHDEDEGIREPSLATPECHLTITSRTNYFGETIDFNVFGGDQTEMRGGRLGNRKDFEEDHDGREPDDGDKEPSLARSEAVDQTLFPGSDSEREEDNDSGIADIDALDLDRQEYGFSEWGLRSTITEDQRETIRATERTAMRMRLPKSGLTLEFRTFAGKQIAYARSV